MLGLGSTNKPAPNALLLPLCLTKLRELVKGTHLFIVVTQQLITVYEMHFGHSTLPI